MTEKLPQAMLERRAHDARLAEADFDLAPFTIACARACSAWAWIGATWASIWACITFASGGGGAFGAASSC